MRIAAVIMGLLVSSTIPTPALGDIKQASEIEAITEFNLRKMIDLSRKFLAIGKKTPASSGQQQTILRDRSPCGDSDR